MRTTLFILTTALLFGIQACKFEKEGCTDVKAVNFDIDATKNDSSCIYTEAPVYGCSNPKADNYNPLANTDDGSCIFSGCTNPAADNYDPFANNDDGSCIITGCMDSTAWNYNPLATISGSCDYDWRPAYKGSYTVTDDGNCTGFGLVTIGNSIDYNPAVNDTVDITTFSSFMPLSVIGIVNAKNITIPSQSFGIAGGTFSANGTLTTANDTTITLNVTWDDNVFNQGSCVITFTK